MSDGLRVAMLAPSFWPEVRRGTERTVHELSTGLIRRGHRPLVITSHRGWPQRGVEEGVPVLRLPRPPDGRLRRRDFEDHLTHVPLSALALRAGDYDVAHAWFTTDALAAAGWRRRTGRPAVHSFMGIPSRLGMTWKRRRLDITLRAHAGCDVTVALSRHCANEAARWFGWDTPVIPPPVDVDIFKPAAERSPEPTVVCAASPDTPGKRVGLLVRAFAIVRRERPEARLLLNRPRDTALAASLARPGDGIELVGMDDRRELARLYASAWVSALPSMGEAFGLVLAEALACGTPGVGSNLDGIPEVIGRPEIGRLFEGDDERGLARALLEAFELATDPATAGACRERALEFSSERCVTAYERLYRELLER